MHFTLRAVTCSLCGLNSTYETTAQHCKTVPSTQNTLPPPLFAKPARYSLESPKAQMPNFCVSNIPSQISHVVIYTSALLLQETGGKGVRRGSRVLHS